MTTEDKEERQSHRWDWDAIPLALLFVVVTPGFFWLGLYGAISNRLAEMTDAVTTTNNIMLFGLSIIVCIISATLFCISAAYALKRLFEEDKEDGK